MIKKAGLFQISRVVITILVSFALAVVVFTSCDTGESISLGPAVKVYYCGFDGSDNACYWTGNVKTLLNLPEGTSAELTGIAVSGGKVYIAGTYRENESYFGKPCYWISGKFYELELENVEEEDDVYYHMGRITVSDNKVYIAGSDFIKIDDDFITYTACYWVDGKKVNLYPPPEPSIPPSSPSYSGGLIPVYPSWADFIDVSGGSVYVTGAYDYGNGWSGHTMYCYWKDDQPLVKLREYNEDSFDLYDIAVSGSGEMCLIKWYYDSPEYPHYYKNGVEVELPLPEGITKGFAETITFHDQEWYVTGTFCDENDYIRPCYWDSSFHYLDDEAVVNATVFGMAFSGGSVYVVGFYEAPGGVMMGCYWKDGEFFATGIISGDI